MKKSTVIFGVLILALLAYGIYYTFYVSGTTKAKEPRHWRTQPSTPTADKNAPYIPKSHSFKNRMGLGSNGTKQGDPRNKAIVPEFICTGKHEYCEVTFFANVKSGLKDNEQLRVNVSAGPFKNIVGYLKSSRDFSHQYRISLKDACGEKVKVTFDWGKRGNDDRGIQSEAYLWGVEHACADVDRTNDIKTGRLLDSSGEELDADRVDP